MSGPLAGVPSVLAELGGDAEEIFADADVDLSLCEHQHNQISALAVERLLLLCAERTSCQHFGLLVGQQANLASLGLLGSLMRSSETLGDALRGLERHLRVRTRGGIVQLKVDGRFRRPQLLPILFNGRGRGPGLRGCAGGDDAGSSRTVRARMGSYRGSRAAKDTWEPGTLPLGLSSPDALQSRSGRVGLPSQIAEAATSECGPDHASKAAAAHRRS